MAVVMLSGRYNYASQKKKNSHGSNIKFHMQGNKRGHIESVIVVILVFERSKIIRLGTLGTLGKLI
jgi:hypothetical protein